MGKDRGTPSNHGFGSKAPIGAEADEKLLDRNPDKSTPMPKSPNKDHVHGFPKLLWRLPFKTPFSG